MTTNDLKLVPATQPIAKMPRSKYMMLVQQFLDRDETELQVEGGDGKLYGNLNAAVARMNVKDRVCVRKRGKEIHLIRLG